MNNLPFDASELARAAIDARAFAYAPYSRFAVGAALLTAGGRVFSGCNVESCASPATCCAERVALFSAIASGERSFAAIAVAGGPVSSPADAPMPDYVTPCGMCRQALAEFCSLSPAQPFYVVCAKTPRDYTVHTLGELLPAAFTLASS